MVNNMKEKNELILHIYKDAEMGIFTTETLLKDLKEKDNKIKKTLEDTLKEYQIFKEKTKEILEKENAEIKENGFISKMMASMGINREVNKDNSDAAIADMLVKGISMGTLDMQKKIKDYDSELSKKDLNLAKEFLKFQEKSIETYKKFL